MSKENLIDKEYIKRLENMLATVIDSNYGIAYHHIGDGDGMTEEEAVEIRNWWKDYVEHPEKRIK